MLSVERRWHISCLMLWRDLVLFHVFSSADLLPVMSWEREEKKKSFKLRQSFKRLIYVWILAWDIIAVGGTRSREGECCVRGSKLKSKKINCQKADVVRGFASPL